VLDPVRVAAKLANHPAAVFQVRGRDALPASRQSIVERRREREITVAEGKVGQRVERPDVVGILLQHAGVGRPRREVLALGLVARGAREIPLPLGVVGVDGDFLDPLAFDADLGLDGFH
jgi:hypothetical protein